MPHRDGAKPKTCEACGGALMDLARTPGEATACPHCLRDMLVRPLRSQAGALGALDPNPNGGVELLREDGTRARVVKAEAVWIMLAGNLGGGAAFIVLERLGLFGRWALIVGIAWCAVAVVAVGWRMGRPRVVSCIDAPSAAFRVAVRGRAALQAPFRAVRRVHTLEARGTSDEYEMRDVCVGLDAGSFAIARLELRSAEAFALELAKVVGAPYEAPVDGGGAASPPTGSSG
jgi:hypothetical protein